MKPQPGNKRPESINCEGTALVLALVIVVVVSLMGVSAAKMSIGGKWRSTNYVTAKQALYAAEAGVEDGVGRLIATTITDTDPNNTAWNNASTYASSTSSFTNSFTVKHLLSGGNVVKDLGGLPYYVVEATGYDSSSKNARKTVRAVVSLRREYLFVGAMTGCSSITASGRASVDSYDSSEGSYSSTSARGNGSLGTCDADSDISLSGSVSIRGNVSATGTIITSGSPSVIGTTKTDAPTSECDPIDVATYVSSHRPAGTPTPVEMSTGTMTITAPDTFYYSGIHLTGQSKLVVDGSGSATIFIDGDLNMEGQSSFELVSGVKLTIYVTGTISLAGQEVINNGPPTNLILYSSNTSDSAVSVTGGSAFGGAIYAPLGGVALSGDSDFYGAVRGRTVNDSGTAEFHYDEQLGKMPVGPIQGHTIVNWKEVFN